jgi:hypothetical protein
MSSESSATPQGALLRAIANLAKAPLDASVALARLGLDVERQARAAALAAAEDAMLDALDAIVSRLFSPQVIDRLLDRVETSGVAQRVTERILEDGIAEQIAERALAGPELEHVLASAFKSALPDELIAQALASEAVWLLVDEIARSPSVTDAISHQSTGVLEQAAAKARDRSRTADARLERVAARLSLRRRSRARAKGGESVPLTRPPGWAGES